MKLTTELVQIAIAGGGFIIDANSILTTDLVKIANASSTSGAKIILTNVNNKLTVDLVKISVAGKGNVIFDLR